LRLVGLFQRGRAECGPGRNASSTSKQATPPARNPTRQSLATIPPASAAFVRAYPDRARRIVADSSVENIAATTDTSRGYWVDDSQRAHFVSPVINALDQKPRMPPRAAPPAPKPPQPQSIQPPPAPTPPRPTPVRDFLNELHGGLRTIRDRARASVERDERLRAAIHQELAGMRGQFGDDPRHWPERAQEKFQYYSDAHLHGHGEDEWLKRALPALRETPAGVFVQQWESFPVGTGYGDGESRVFRRKTPGSRHWRQDRFDGKEAQDVPTLGPVVESYQAPRELTLGEKATTVGAIFAPQVLGPQALATQIDRHAHPETKTRVKDTPETRRWIGAQERATLAQRAKDEAEVTAGLHGSVRWAPEALQQGNMAVASSVLRPMEWLGIAPENSADSNNRLAEAVEAEFERRGGTVTNLARNAGASFYQAYFASQFGGQPAVVAGFAATAADRAFTEAKDAGKSDVEARNYAVRAGMIEGTITTIFIGVNKLLPGMGGWDSSFQKGFFRNLRSMTPWQRAYHGVKGGIGEQLEEGGIAGAEIWNRDYSGVNPTPFYDASGNAADVEGKYGDKGDWMPGWKVVFSTMLQTLFTQGAGTVRHHAGAMVHREPGAAELHSPLGIVSLAVAEPTKAQAIVETPTPENIARQTGTSLKDWSDGSARSELAGALSSALSVLQTPQAQHGDTPATATAPADASRTSVVASTSPQTSTQAPTATRVAPGADASESNVTNAARPERSRPADQPSAARQETPTPGINTRQSQGTPSTPSKSLFDQDGYVILSNGSRRAFKLGSPDRAPANQSNHVTAFLGVSSFGGTSVIDSGAQPAPAATDPKSSRRPRRHPLRCESVSGFINDIVKCRINCRHDRFWDSWSHRRLGPLKTFSHVFSALLLPVPPLRPRTACGFDLLQPLGHRSGPFRLLVDEVCPLAGVGREVVKLRGDGFRLRAVG